jgi:CBS domain-containing protein
MQRVEQLMTRIVRTCRPQDTLDVAAQIMWEEDCGCVPVVTRGEGRSRLVGMITDRDVCMAALTQGRALHAIEVTSAMARELASCRPTDTVLVALQVLRTKRLRRLPVVATEDELVGILSLADLVRASADGDSGKLGAEQLASALQAICEPRFAPGEIVPVRPARRARPAAASPSLD